MDRQGLLQLLQDTLSPEKGVRSQAENALAELQKQPGLLLACLELAVDSAQKQEVQVSAAIYFKNKVRQFWFVKDGVPARLAEYEISAQEKASIKEKLIPAVYSVCFSTGHVSLQLLSALQTILSLRDWDDLPTTVVQLLGQSSHLEYVYTGLLCLKELVKQDRYEVGEKRNRLNQLVAQCFPLIEPLLTTLSQNLHDSKSGQMCYAVLKVFKYATFTYLPPYLQDMNTLSTWCKFHIELSGTPFPPEILELDDEDASKTQDPRVKAKKWAFGNMHKFQSRHAGGISSRNENPEFSDAFCQHFTPQILNSYWEIVNQWHSDPAKHWLSSLALYHLIGFINECVRIEATWPLIEQKLTAVLSHIVLPTLSATESSVEMFEDDPEEYLRQQFNFRSEHNTADVGSSSLVYALAKLRMAESMPLILQLLSQLFETRNSNQSDAKIAMQSEAGLRILGTCWDLIVDPKSPVSGQVEDIIRSFILPQLQDKKFPFLRARACETLALMEIKFSDMELLSALFEQTLECFQKENSLPLQVEAADALRFLASNEAVERSLAPNVPAIISQLLDFSNRYEIDLINNIIDDFVLKFADQLEPFAAQLASNLCQQFVRLATELIQLEAENPAAAQDSEKEFQASSIINTMTTMIFTMTSSTELTLSLLREFSPAITLVLENALTVFSTEAMEILETANYTLKKMSPEMWHFFDLTTNAFNLYGNEYYEDYQAFFDTCITYGFREVGFSDARVQKFLGMVLEMLDSREEEGGMADFCYELVYSIILSIGPSVSVALPDILKVVVSTEEKLESSQDLAPDFDMCLRSFLKIILSALYVCPTQLISTLGPEMFLKYMALYFENADDHLITVFDLKLQIMALMSLLLNTAQFPQIQSHAAQFIEKLLQCLEVLPSVLTKRMELMKKDLNLNREPLTEEELWESQEEQESRELTRDTALDNINIYAEFKQFMANPHMQQLASGLGEDKQKLIQLLTSS